MSPNPRCRFCDRPLEQTFADLGSTPLANAYLRATDADRPEPSYPLHARVCSECLLVQIPQVVTPEELFGDYAYYSSFSTSWLEHSKRFADSAVERLNLGSTSLVVEVASNDGYLLRFFQEAGVPVLGVEPARNVAKDAIAAGIPTETEFFGTEYAVELVRRGLQADLLIGNNVLAHVPDINDFVGGLATALKTTGTLVMEFPHLLNLITEVQFDTIYHEHFSYLSLLAVERIFAAHGLTVYDVERIPTHGGSLRVLAALHESAHGTPADRVQQLRSIEEAAGLNSLATYAAFAETVEAVKGQLQTFLHEAKATGKSVAAYGAAAKGNTLLNTIGATVDLIDYVADRSPHKQGLLLPGSHIPIHPPERIFETRPDYVLILPWNLTAEIIEQMAEVRSWGGQFVVAIPQDADHPMRFTETPIAGVVVIDLDPISDDRGFFARSYSQDAFAEHSILFRPVEANVSGNSRAATFRGLHFQAEPYPDPKLVRCTAGAMFDVAVDLRPDSVSYCRWYGTTLSAGNRRALHVPAGCAHGFITLEDATEVLYLMGERYHLDLSRGVRWNDPAFAIEWPFAPRIISERDAEFADFVR